MQQLKDVMSPDVQVIRPDTTLCEAAAQMWDEELEVVDTLVPAMAQLPVT